MTTPGWRRRRGSRLISILLLEGEAFKDGEVEEKELEDMRFR
jgi:hypothetical protein